MKIINNKIIVPDLSGTRSNIPKKSIIFLLYSFFAFSVFANFLFFKDLNFGAIVLPHQVGILQLVTFSTFLIILFFTFFLKSEDSLNIFFAWVVVLSGSAFLRYTISDDIAFIIFAIFILFFRTQSITLIKKRNMHKLLLSFLFLQTVMSIYGSFYSFYAVRFFLVFVSTVVVFQFISTKSDKQFTSMIEAAYWPIIFYVFMCFAWWFGIHSYTIPKNAVLIGSLEGIGYAGTSHKEIPLIFLSLASLIKFHRTSLMRYLVLATIFLAAFVVIADSRLATMILLTHLFSVFLINLRIWLQLMIFSGTITLILILSIGGDISLITNYIEGFVRIFSSSADTHSYAYRDTTITTQTGDIGRIFFILAAFQYLIFEFPSSLFGCGVYGFYGCAEPYLIDVGYVAFTNLTGGSVDTWNSTGLTRAPFLPSVIVETGMLGFSLLIFFLLSPFFKVKGKIKRIFFIGAHFIVAVAFCIAGYLSDITIYFVVFAFLHRVANSVFLK